MRQLVSKLKQGLTSIERPTVTIVVFGGSTAAGAELDDMDTHFANLFGKWLEDNFHVEVILINTAVGATSSDYYAMCAGRHLHSGVDIVLGEHAVNDRGDDKYEYGPRLYKPYEASVTEALMLQVRQHAPSAIFVYVAFISLHRYCRNGEDLPQFLEVLGTYGAAAVSIRNMLLGRPSNPDNCNLDMISNALWDQLFKNRRHPTEVSHSYLAAALMNIITEEISYWLQDVEGKVTPPLILKNSNIFSLNRAVSSMGELVFACRTTLHPSFGSSLFPLPTGCEISWNSIKKYFFVYNCSILVFNNVLKEGKIIPQYFEISDFLDNTVLPELSVNSQGAVVPNAPLPDYPMPAINGWLLEEFQPWDPGIPNIPRRRMDYKFAWVTRVHDAPIIFPIITGRQGYVGAVIFTSPGSGLAKFCAQSVDVSQNVCQTIDAAFPFRVTKTFLLFKDLQPNTPYLLQAVSMTGELAIVSIAVA